MKVECKAIVIKNHRLPGSDSLITLITREYGKKRVYVNGARKLNSSLSAASQLFVEGDYLLYFKENLSTLSMANINNFHKNLRDNLNKFFLASYLLELVDKFSQEGDLDIDLFDFLSFALSLLENEKEDRLKFFRIVFTIKLLNKIGLMPGIDHCTNCSSAKNLNYFSSFSGGLLCNKCKNSYSDSEFLDENLIKLIKYSYIYPYLQLNKIKLVSEKIETLDIHLDNFIYEHILSTKLKSKKTVEEMNL